MIVVLLVVLIALTSMVMFLWRSRNLIKLGFTMPHKGSIPFVGGLPYIKGLDELIDGLTLVFDELGDTFFSWMGPKALIVTRDADFIEAVLNSPNCYNKSSVMKPLRTLLGDGLLTQEGRQWQIHRKYINPSFSINMLLSFFGIFNKTANELCDSLKKYVDAGDCDLRQEFSRSIINTSTETTMGKLLEAGSKIDLLPQYETCMEGLMIQILRPWFQIEALFKLHRLYEPVKIAKNKIFNIVNDLIEENVKENTDYESKIFIKQAIKLAQEKKFTLDDVEIQSNSIIVGAFETTSTAIDHILFCLAEHSECQEKLYDEIINVLPDDVDITNDHLKKMPYLSMVFNESLRLLPPILFNPREAKESFQLSDKTWVPKGVQIMISNYHVQRNEKYWGPKANEFNPENFSLENVFKRNPYAFIPFSKGARNCIGSRYAQFSVKIMLAKLVRKYKFSTDYRLKDVVIIPSITTKIKNHPKLRVSLR